MNALFIRALITEKCVECVSFEKCVKCARSNHGLGRLKSRVQNQSFFDVVDHMKLQLIMNRKWPMNEDNEKRTICNDKVA